MTIVNVTYTKDLTGQLTIIVYPEVAEVRLGDTIEFQRSSPQGHSVVLTFNATHTHLFENLRQNGELHEQDGNLRLKTDPGILPELIPYDCDLLDPTGKSVAHKEGIAGGAVKPIKEIS